MDCEAGSIEKGACKEDEYLSVARSKLGEW